MSKLTAKDLMIGDWVCFDGDTEHTNPVQIDGISTEEACVDGDWYDVWEPIPLTAEILEENGWESYSHENTPIWGMIQGFEIVLAWMSYYWQLCVDGTIYRQIQIKHVHELQHALKLCGIEKEIEL